MSKLDLSKPMVFRGGNIPVRLLGRVNAKTAPLVFAWTDSAGIEHVTQRPEDGRPNGPFIKDPRDVINVIEKKSTFQNVYRDGISLPYKTLINAKAGKVPGSRHFGVLEMKYEDDEIIDVVFHKSETL